MSREKRWNNGGDEQARRHTTRNTLIALMLASASLMTLDHATGASSPLDPVRRGVGEVMSPVEKVATAAVRPFAAVPDFFTGRDDLRGQVTSLASENAALRAELAANGFNRNRLAEFEALTRTAQDQGTTLVPTRVIGYGAAQSFSRTVTIDAGTTSGITPDLTVINHEGLVGRVLRVTRSSATVLLVTDADSTVGGRIGDSMEIGFLKGRGALDADTLLDFEMLDASAVPAEGETVVTWGDSRGGPYVSGIPVGKVTAVFSSLRDNTRRAEIEPLVDFSSLDLLGVVVPSGQPSDRAIIEVDGSIQ